MNDKLTTGSLFTGYAGIERGLEQTGRFTTKWVCEINEFGAAILTDRFPNAPNLGDITQVDWNNVERVDVLTGGFPCFAAGTMVLTMDGYKPIEEVVKGDLVLTHKGRWRPVTSTMRRSANETILLEGQGFLPIRTTSEHPFLTGVEEWTPAGALKKGSRVAIVDTPCGALQNIPLCRIIGRYLADGWRVQRKGRENTGRVVICARHEKAPSLARELAQAGLHATKVEERTVVKFHITQTWFYRFIAQFDDGARNKHLPGHWLSMPRDAAEAILNGYLAGDGNKTTYGYRATTISKRLAHTILLLGKKVYGTIGSIYFTKRAPTTIIEGRTVRQQDTYTVQLYRQSKKTVNEGAYGWTRLKKSTRTTGCLVYNISVDEDESYTANNIVVHNCQDISNAGKRVGIAGERSGLWKEYLRAIGVLRPKYVLAENVAALTQRGLDVVVADLIQIGYRVEWDNIPASAVGAPHRRDRTFIIGVRSDVADAEGAGLSGGRVGGGSAQDRAVQYVWSRDCGTTVADAHDRGRDGVPPQDRGERRDEPSQSHAHESGERREQAGDDADPDSDGLEAVAHDGLLREQALGAGHARYLQSGSTAELLEQFRQSVGAEQWEQEIGNGVHRMVDGPTYGMDDAQYQDLVAALGEAEAKKLASYVWKERIRALGNGVVPQVAMFLGILISNHAERAGVLREHGE
jgi:site-specific DNA-cytosine methylase